MGFGTLILGYFLMYAFSISEVYFFADIIGAAIVIFAFSKLAQYNRYFACAMWLCLAYLALCAYGAMSLMFELYGASSAVAYLLLFSKSIISCAMHTVMFLGIRGISLGADSVKLAGRAKRNMVITAIYYTLYIVLSAVSLAVESYILSYVSAVLQIFYLVCIVLNLILIYSSFGTLCPADEDENEVKRSRFGFINKMNDKMDDFEKKSNEYRRESMKLAMEEAEKNAAAKSKKKKHKKKK